MKQRKPEGDGRFYNLPYNYILVCQQPKGMVVQSRHKKREVAITEGQRLNRLSEVAVYAVLTMIGNPEKDYRPGDTVDPSDISWRQPRSNDTCSECCHPFAYGGTPQSLEHRCVLLRDNPPCEQVQSLIVRRKGDSK